MLAAGSLCTPFEINGSSNLRVSAAGVSEESHHFVHRGDVEL